MDKIKFNVEKLVGFLVILTMGLLVVGCKDDNGQDEPEPEPGIIWDFSPYAVYIRIVDREGADLLSPDAGEHSLYGDLMYMVYNGNEYPAEWPENLETRYYVPQFYGLKLAQYESADGPRFQLIFGDFDGGSNADRSMQFLIHKINTFFNIGVSNQVEWNKGEPKVSRTYWLNGQLVEKGIITITL